MGTAATLVSYLFGVSAIWVSVQQVLCAIVIFASGYFWLLVGMYLTVYFQMVRGFIAIDGLALNGDGVIFVIGWF